jgi:dihydroneopterin aldolase
MKSVIELKGLELKVSLGTYGQNDVVPSAHILDLTLTIDSRLAFIDEDSMDRVFDYDPLLAQIDEIARDGHYHTQERLMTRIVELCASYAVIEGVDISISKTPVMHDSGCLGVRLIVGADEMAELRKV